jgi:DNA-directed RNA polymerase I, II, and III subunit RPABC5
VRCVTCRKVVGNKYDKYCMLLREGKSTKDALTELGLRRICCRRMLLGECDMITKRLDFQTSVEPESLQGVEHIPRTEKKTICIAR